jgi:hypothetical protein
MITLDPVVNTIFTASQNNSYFSLKASLSSTHRVFSYCLRTTVIRCGPFHVGVSPSFFSFLMTNIYYINFHCFALFSFPSSCNFLIRFLCINIFLNTIPLPNQSSVSHQIQSPKRGQANHSSPHQNRSRINNYHNINQKSMCFTLIGTLVCRCCDRAISKLATGVVIFCQGGSPCGRYVSKNVDEKILGMCVVCEASQEERRIAAARLNRAFQKK